MEKNRTLQQNARRTFRPLILVTTRVLLVLLFCGSAAAWSPLSAQDSQVTLRVKEMSLGDVVKELKKQTGKDFLFSNREVNVERKVTLNVTNMALKEVLPLVFGKDFRFEISENVVVVRPFVAVTKDGQQAGIVVKGVVTDNRKQSLPGVTIKLVNTSVGTATDADGRFSLRLPITKGSLEFSFVGFKTQTVNFTESTKDTIRVVLEEDIANLDEVQVVAYGSQKKRTVVSAISSIKADDIKELPTHSLENLLQGHMAGVEVNNMSGAPGGGGSIVTIRGYSGIDVGSSMVSAANGGEGDEVKYGTPLYVVDGVPIQAFTSTITGANTLSSLDPSMIESIEVLKDAASAAIYGSRAGNGVILITTKKGRSGQAQFSANVSYSAAWIPKTPEQSGGQLERRYHLQGLKNTVTPYKGADGIWRVPESYQEIFDYTGYNAPMLDWFWGTGKNGNTSWTLQDSLNPFNNNSTDWWKYAFRTAKVYNANIQASGGSDAFRYMIGAGYYKEEGIMYGSDFQRINVLTNISVHPTKRLTLDNQISLSYSDRSKGGNSGMKVEGMTVNPMSQTTLNPGGTYIEANLLESLNSIEDKNHSYDLRYNLVLDYEIARDLYLRVTGGVSYNQQNANTFTPSTMDKTYHFSSSQGVVGRSLSILNENLLSYKLKIKQEHNFDVLLGLSFQKDQAYKNDGKGINGPNDLIHYVQGTWGGNGGLNDYADASSETRDYRSAFNFTSDFEEERMNSYFGRLSYNYKEKYLFETTIRRDGSSVFGEQVRWATFPSVAVGWAFSEEPFMKRFYWLSFGKIRASWGTSGQKFSQRYLAQGLMESTRGTFLGDAGMKPASSGGVINRRLSWQETDQYDIGLDVDFFNYRLKLVMDYYYRYTKGQLNTTSLPGDIYYHSFQWQNALDVSNEGLELELTADILRESAVKWRMKFNVSRNWNRFEKSADGYDYNSNVIGKPLNRLRVYKTDGYYNSFDEVPVYAGTNGLPVPLITGGQGVFFGGTRKILDLNGDGMINSNDCYYAASSLPVAHGGLSHDIRWKQFDLNVMFTYSLGRHILNLYRHETALPKLEGGPIMFDINKTSSWTGPDSGDADYPYLQLYQNLTNQYTGMYDTNIEKVNMFRLKQLTLGYNLHERFAKKVGLVGARVFLTMENVFLLTNYSGIDPEIVDITSGKDKGAGYPLPRKFTVGLTVNF